MKYLLVIVWMTLLLGSCTKRDNSRLNVACTDSCTTVMGRITTGNNEPVADLHLEVYWEDKPPSGLGTTTIRKLAAGETDNGGNYSFTFRISADDYHRKPYVKMDVGYDTKRYLSIPWYDYGWDEIAPLRSRKDTTVIMDYYLASKAWLRIRFNNFTASSTADSFYILPVYHDVGYNRTQETIPQYFSATAKTSEKTIEIAGNLQHTITVIRKKNGVRTATDMFVYTPEGKTTDLFADY